MWMANGAGSLRSRTNENSCMIWLKSVNSNTRRDYLPVSKFPSFLAASTKLIELNFEINLVDNHSKKIT